MNLISINGSDFFTASEGKINQNHCFRVSRGRTEGLYSVFNQPATASDELN